MPNSLVSSAARSAIEGFVNPENSSEKKTAYVDFAAMLISFIISVVILSLIGKLLWNGIITELFTCVRPAKNIWQILGLFVFVGLIL
jgi:hypothetical protein